jgi:hypothetical protein
MITLVSSPKQHLRKDMQHSVLWCSIIHRPAKHTSWETESHNDKRWLNFRSYFHAWNHCPSTFFIRFFVHFFFFFEDGMKMRKPLTMTLLTKITFIPLSIHYRGFKWNLNLYDWCFPVIQPDLKICKRYSVFHSFSNLIQIEISHSFLLFWDAWQFLGMGVEIQY